MAEMKIDAFCATGLSGLRADRLHTTKNWSGALKVRLGESALDVANRVDKAGARLVVVLGPGNEPVGVVAPGPLVDYLNGMLAEPATSLTDALTKLRAADFIDVTRYRPPLYYCEKGKHYSSSKPCPEHL
jgi:hypothetical protein